jgi:hypothetical protein
MREQERQVKGVLLSWSSHCYGPLGTIILGSVPKAPQNLRWKNGRVTYLSTARLLLVKGHPREVLVPLHFWAYSGVLECSDRETLK